MLPAINLSYLLTVKCVYDKTSVKILYDVRNEILTDSFFFLNKKWLDKVVKRSFKIKKKLRVAL